MKSSLISILLLLLVSSCNKEEIIYFYSLEKSQCVTVINQNNFRYIIDGKHHNLPDSNFIKVNLQDVDPLGNGLWICWENEKYKWDIVVADSKIVDSKLDTTKFNFSTSLPKDELGLPTEIKFRQDGCAVFDFYSMKLSPDNGAIVEFY